MKSILWRPYRSQTQRAESFIEARRLVLVNQNEFLWVNEISSGKAGHFPLIEQILVKWILELKYPSVFKYIFA